MSDSRVFIVHNLQEERVMEMPPDSREEDIDRIRRLIADRLRISTKLLSDGMSLEDIGLDSITLAEVIAIVETDYGIVLDTTLFAERVSPVTSLRELLENIMFAISSANASR
jgi:acyl carrier protein